MPQGKRESFEVVLLSEVVRVDLLSFCDLMHADNQFTLYLQAWNNDEVSSLSIILLTT